MFFYNYTPAATNATVAMETASRATTADLRLRPWPCPYCPKTFGVRAEVKRHLRTHTGEKPYKCSFCERAFSESSSLAKHRRRHLGANAAPCPECGVHFGSPSSLKFHRAAECRFRAVWAPTAASTAAPAPAGGQRRRQK